MSTPALLAITNPKAVPAAAEARLLVTSASLLAASTTVWAGPYSSWLSHSASLAAKASTLLSGAIDATATRNDLAGLLNAERLSKASIGLFNEVAHRSSGRERVEAMRWASLYRNFYHDAALTQREFAYVAKVTSVLSDALVTAAIRIQPGAESALQILERDPLLFASGWPLETLSTQLASHVVMS